MLGATRMNSLSQDDAIMNVVAVVGRQAHELDKVKVDPSHMIEHSLKGIT